MQLVFGGATRIAQVAAVCATLAVIAASCANGAQVAVPSCGASETECATACADLQVDTENCGKCGFQCGAAEACVKGACATQCPSADTLCSAAAGDAGKTSGKCVNTKTDNKNCGACGKSCKAGEICFGGACGTTCGDSKTGQTACGGDAGAPYCANLKTDNGNCGSCGKACPSGQACVAGACAGACTQDQTLCAGDGGAAYCANLQSDNANCGACGALCSSLEACGGGACVPQCASNQLSCRPDGGAPYCADGMSDNVNCGACGNVCPVNKPVCSGGYCSKGSLCGNNLIDVGERCDNNLNVPGGGQVSCQPSGSPNACKFNFSQVPQLYCNGSCSWAGAQGCDQADADIYCKLITGSATSTASSFGTATALPVGGFPCPSYPTNLGPMPEYGVSVNVWYQGASILGNHGPGTVINKATCTP